MAAQEIAVTCKNCGEKTRCTIAEWTTGFACPHCGADIQRPSPKKTDAKATAKIQLDSLIRPTVSAVSLTPAADGAKKEKSDSASLKIIRGAEGGPSASSQLKIIRHADGDGSGSAPPAASDAAPPAAAAADSAAVQRLTVENKSLRDNLKDVTVKSAKAEAELEVLREQQDEQNRKLSGLQNEISTLKRARAKLQDQVRELTEEKADASVTLQEDLAQVRSARDDAEASLAKLQVEHKIIKEKLDQFIKEKVDLGRKVKELDERGAKLEEEKDQLAAESAGIKDQRDSLEKEKAELEKEREQLQAKTLDLAKKVIPQDKLDEFKSRLTSEVTQNKVAAAKLQKASEELQKLRVELAKKDAAVKALAKAKAMADKKVEEAEKVAADASANDEEQEKAALENSILREKLDGLITELHAHEDTIKSNAETIKKLESQANALQTERDDARADLDKKEAEIDAVSDKHESALATAQAEIKTLKEQLAAAEAAPAAEGSAAPDPAQAARLRELEAEVTNLNQQLADLEQADDADRKLLEEENQELKARISGLESASKEAGAASGAADAEKLLELKKAYARSLAENKIIKEKMGAMVEDVKRSRAHIEAMSKVNAQLQEQVRAYAHETPSTEEGSAEKVQELVTRVSELASAKAALERENAKLKSDAESPSDAAAAPDAKPDPEAEKTIAALTADKTALETKLAELQAKVDAAPAADGDASEALMRAEIEAKITREKITELVAELDTAHKELEQTKAALDAAKKAPAPAAGDAAATVDDAALKKLQDENAALQKDLAAAKEAATKAAEQAKASAPAAPIAAVAAGTAGAAALIERETRIAELEAELATVRDAAEKAQSEAETARELLADADDGKKKKKGPPDKVRILELTEENKQLQTDIDKIRKKIKEDRSEKLRGFVVPSVSDDIEALAHRNHELEHKLAALEQERQQMLQELHDWRDDGELNDSIDELKAKPVAMDFPEAAERIVRDIIGDSPVVYAATTEQKADTGLWGRKSTCYLAITATDVVVAAPGKKDVVQRIPRKRTADSFWNPVTEQLVFAPGLDDVPLPGLAMSRTDADAAMVYMRASRIEVEQPAAESTT